MKMKIKPKDSLGNRMKAYENVSRHSLIPRCYTIIRVDGKAFHTFTKKFKRPFDESLVKMMNATAVAMAKEIQGCKLVFVQSDEISLVLTDFDELNTSAWFDGTVEKIVSVSASIATREFNKQMLMHTIMTSNKLRHDYLITALEVDEMKFVEFDSRAFNLPTRDEVFNYLIWRQQDATRNSIAMVAQSLYSHGKENSELHGKSCDQMQEMIFQKGINWNDFNDGLKRGRCVMRVPETVKVIDRTNDDKKLERNISKWTVVNPPVFTQDREFLKGVIPDNV